MLITFFIKCESKTVTILDVVGIVDYFIYDALDFDNFPETYQETFNVVLCNFLMRHHHLVIAPLKQDIFYKYNINAGVSLIKSYSKFFPLHDTDTLIKSPLVYRFDFRIEFLSTDMLQSILSYLYFLPVEFARHGLCVRNCYFSYYKL